MSAEYVGEEEERKKTMLDHRIKIFQAFGRPEIDRLEEIINQWLSAHKVGWIARPANRPAETPFNDSTPLKVQVTHLIMDQRVNTTTVQ